MTACVGYLSMMLNAEKKLWKTRIFNAKISQESFIFGRIRSDGKNENIKNLLE